MNRHDRGRRMGVSANEPSMNGSLFIHRRLPTDNSPSPSTVWFIRCGEANREAPASDGASPYRAGDSPGSGGASPYRAGVNAGSGGASPYPEPGLPGR
jgi:hypothetical protein